MCRTHAGLLLVNVTRGHKHKVRASSAVELKVQRGEELVLFFSPAVQCLAEAAPLRCHLVDTLPACHCLHETLEPRRLAHNQHCHVGVSASCLSAVAPPTCPSVETRPRLFLRRHHVGQRGEQHYCKHDTSRDTTHAAERHTIVPMFSAKDLYATEQRCN